jgi:hypothetical protein
MYVFIERDWAGVSHFLAALLLTGAAIALLFVSLGGDSSAGPTVPDADGVGSVARSQITIRDEAPERTFAVGGASFLVRSRPEAGWASSFRARAAKPGQHWMVAAVEVANISRHGFNPGLLSYLARGPHGALFAPLRAGAVGPQGLGLASGLPAGARAEERLVFSLPDSLRHPVLAIQPSPTQALEVRVPLGA